MAMNDSFKLSINKPCQQKFSSFEPTPEGGFCGSCQKVVVDFTNMTDAEIKDYFKTVTGKTCGRFGESQLKQYTSSPSTSPVFNHFSVGTSLIGISLLSILPFTQASSQDKPQEINSQVEQQQNAIEDLNSAAQPAKDSLLTGVVKDAKSGETLPFVNIMLEDRSAGVSTDFDGKFTFPKPLKEGDTLILSYLGYETVYHTLSNEECLSLSMRDVDLLISEIIVMGEVSVNQVYSSKTTFWQKLKSFFS